MATANATKTPSSDIVRLLSPSSDIDGLVGSSVKAYNLVKDASDTLLTKSTLDLDAFREASSESDQSLTMRELIVQAAGDFTSFVQGEVDLCSNLKAYGGILLQVLPELTIEEYVLSRLEDGGRDQTSPSASARTDSLRLVETLTPMIKPYQDSMAAASKTRGERAAKVCLGLQKQSYLG